LDLCKPCTNLHVTTVEKVFITNFWTSTKCAQINIWERSGLWSRNFFSFQTYATMHKSRWANIWELLQNHGSIYYKEAGDLVCNTHNKFKTWTLNSWHLDTVCIWAISFSLFLLLQSFESYNSFENLLSILGKRNWKNHSFHVPFGSFFPKHDKITCEVMSCQTFKPLF
jgi:hypothetical protein